MDLEQRFIEENKFDVDEFFAIKVEALSKEAAQEIISDIIAAVQYLPKKSGFYQEVYGVVYCESIFYIIEYLNEIDEKPFIIDIDIAGLDEYLDAIIDNNTLRYYTTH